MATIHKLFSIKSIAISLIILFQFIQISESFEESPQTIQSNGPKGESRLVGRTTQAFHNIVERLRETTPLSMIFANLQHNAYADEIRERLRSQFEKILKNVEQLNGARTLQNFAT